MKLTSLTTSSAILVALTVAAAPAAAQERYRGRERPSGQETSGRSTERAQPRSEAPRTGGAAPRVESRQETPRAQAPRQAETPRAQPPRQAETPRVEASRPNAERSGSGNRRNQDFGNESLGRAVPRSGGFAPRVDDNRRNDSRRYDGRRDDDRRFGGRSSIYAPRYSPRYSPRVYGPRSYYRPYVFRPRFSIGFGIFSGYPVPYSYSYAYPIDVYGYGAPRSRVMITPGSSYYGGVALEITPYDADVYVDGEYAGRVEDFDGTTQPLTLTAGTHRIEVQAQGYAPLVVDVGVQAGQVIPYRGELRPY